MYLEWFYRLKNKLIILPTRKCPICILAFGTLTQWDTNRMSRKNCHKITKDLGPGFRVQSLDVRVNVQSEPLIHRLGGKPNKNRTVQRC